MRLFCLVLCVLLWYGRYGCEVDLWSAGVIAYILLGGYPPFYSETNNNEEQFDKIKRGIYQFDPEWWGPVSKLAKDLIAKMVTSIHVPQKYDLYRFAPLLVAYLIYPWVGHETCNAAATQLSFLPLKNFDAIQRWIQMWIFQSKKILIKHMLKLKLWCMPLKNIGSVQIQLIVSQDDRLTPSACLRHEWFLGADNDLLAINLEKSIETLRLWNAKRKFKGAVKVMKNAPRRCQESEWDEGLKWKDVLAWAEKHVCIKRSTIIPIWFILSNRFISCSVPRPSSWRIEWRIWLEEPSKQQTLKQQRLLFLQRLLLSKLPTAAAILC